MGISSTEEGLCLGLTLIGSNVTEEQIGLRRPRGRLYCCQWTGKRMILESSVKDRGMEMLTKDERIER